MSRKCCKTILFFNRIRKIQRFQKEQYLFNKGLPSLRRFEVLRVQAPSAIHIHDLHTSLRVIFSENRELEDSDKKSIFLLFRQNLPFSELIQGKIV